jgi:hypothetical protein
MSSWHRVVLRGLLAVAVAAHGSAGLAMAFCAAAQPTGVSIHGADAADSAHAAHSTRADHPAHAVHSMHADRSLQVAHSEHALHSEHAVEPVHATLQATSADADPDTDSGHAKCSACAACCVAAMPATVPRLAAVANAELFTPVPPSMAPVFETGGPERPPRPRGA